MKVTWTTSQRIHRTLDGERTVCGHVFAGNNRTVHGELHWKKKRHCRTCFVTKLDFKVARLPIDSRDRRTLEHERLEQIIAEARQLREAHDGLHNMHGCYAGIAGWAKHSLVDWTNVGRLITSMRIAARTGKFPIPGEFPYTEKFTMDSI